MRKRIPLTDWGDSPNRFGADYFLDPIHTLHSFEFLLEPFPEPRIIKPYYDHHHTEYKTSAVHGYTSFFMFIYDPALSTGPDLRWASSVSRWKTLLLLRLR
jgi:hypothetical protein